MTTKRMRAEQVTAYWRDGFIYPISVMSFTEAEEYREALEKFEHDHPDYMSGIKRQKLHLLTIWMAELVQHPKILDVLRIYSAQYSLLANQPVHQGGKRPGFVFTSDGNYWGLSSQEL